MKVMKFTGLTMPDIMRSVKKELGDEAIILSSRIVYSGGVFGLFRKKRIEVSAGVDKPAPTLPVREPEFDLHKELQDMKKMIRHMQNTGVSRSPVLDLAERFSLSPVLFENVQFSSDAEQEQRKELQNEVRNKLSLLPIGETDTGKKFITLFGPTGVGKTTTIAKLAARAVLKNKKKVGFITTDTYRIAAIEQLKTYAGLLHAPVEVIYSAEDFQKAITNLKDKDLVFIDTAGRNFKEEKYIKDMQKLIDFKQDMQSYLVLSATAKKQDLETIIQNFKGLELDQLIMTKVDETESVGAVISCMIENDIGLSFFTEGQEVPEDIEEASEDKVLALLFKEDRHG